MSITAMSHVLYLASPLKFKGETLSKYSGGGGRVFKTFDLEYASETESFRLL